MATNTAVSTPNTLEQISSLSQLHIVRQLTFMIILAAAIALGTAVVMWSREPDYSTLYVSMSPQDTAEITSVLEQSGVAYKINSLNGVISVPGSELERVRLQLASQGLPRSTSLGYEILSQDQSLNTSNFMEQARFNHALEEELVHTIRFIRSVRDARVHLSIPQQTSFLRSSKKPSASVMLNLMDGQVPGSTQLAGIVHLVASSVAGLDPENVSIIDQNGNLLSQKGESDYEQSAEHLRIIRNIEQDYTDKIIDILSPVVGLENVRAQVSADIDFTSIETTEESFNPNTIAVRSEQIQEESSQANNQTGPGALTATPPNANPANGEQAQGDSGQSRINTTRNYEVDHSVSHTRMVPGTISRLSVAVLVDLAATTTGAVEGDPADAAAVPGAAEDERIQRLTQLVRDSIGFNAARGDSVNIINERFSPVEEIEFDTASPVWEEAWVQSLAKQGLASVVVLLLIFFVLRPAMKMSVSNQSSLPNRAALPQGAAAKSGELMSPQDNGEAPPQVENLPVSEYDQNLQLAQDLVANEPMRAARMIKEWVASD